MNHDDVDQCQCRRRLVGERVLYELRLTETAIAAHMLGDSGADEPDLDTESLDLALRDD